ncbi:response regulator transcription factor [Burkholderia ubonensis]|uniref:response regulator transcription factor n=1 Tax=Burkholderia ubonensis TaxID=101571 RepID=UPI0009B4C315|nr:response regulator transcription factor [Burkholderia ubonensis]
MNIAVVTSSVIFFNLVCKIFEIDKISCLRFDDHLRVARSIRNVEFSAVLVDVRGRFDSNRSTYIHLMSQLRSKAPVIFLNIQGDRESIVNAFEAGANDVVLAPASSGELYARTIVALRSLQSHAKKAARKNSISLGRYRIDRGTRSVLIGARDVKLTGKEFELIWLLFLHENEVVDRRMISRVVWGLSEAVENRSIEQYIYRLRRKLQLNGELGVCLQTVYSHGYRISENSVGQLLVEYNE